ncbi:unnamed protein product [Heligmosomoides polygyrus]|uniref:Secreted protein n=1 Tax=Heligmosomoides polygyrus TaxID=6339 RepID=A0A183GDD1_HELPZ|nr:unnamed protein product [Heligmosomoides polygyrus]
MLLFLKLSSTSSAVEQTSKPKPPLLWSYCQQLGSPHLSHKSHVVKEIVLLSTMTPTSTVSKPVFKRPGLEKQYLF